MSMSMSSFKIHPKRSMRASRTNNSLYRTGAVQRSMRAANGTKRRGCTYGRKPGGQCRGDPVKSRAAKAYKRAAKAQMGMML